MGVKRRTSQGDAAEDGNASLDAQVKRQHKKPKKTFAAPPTEEEALRRKKQRELRELALKARAVGKGYNPHKAKARVYKEVNKDAVTPRPSQQKAPAAPVSHKPKADFDVAIIPIFWNQQPAQKKMVIAKCAAAQEILALGGVSSHVDEGSHFTPGQKMRHWEEKGVKVRLEVGPRDAEQSRCIIARSQAIPGQVAHKVAGEISATLTAAVQKLLAMEDRNVPKEDRSKYDKKAETAEADNAAQGKGAKASVDKVSKAKVAAKKKAHMGGDNTGSGSDDDDDADGLHGRAAARHVASGDALDDDFDVCIEVADVPEALTDADKKQMKKRRKSGLLKNASGGAVGSDVAAVSVSGGKKRMKVVKVLS